MGKNEGIVEGEEEVALLDWLFAMNCWFVDEAVEVCGRVNSSKKSARRGWCICRYVEEESLLCRKGVSAGQ
jgi:hypothetical protein